MSFPIGPPLIFAAVAVPLLIPIFYLAGAYSTIFRFAGSRTIFHLALAAAVYAIPLAAAFMLRSVHGIPRTIALLHPILFFGLAASSRMFLRYVVMDVIVPGTSSKAVSRVLIYGAGSAGQQLALALRHEPSLLPVAFVDDDRRLDRQRLDGVPIYHSSRLEEIVRTRMIGTVLLAMPRASRLRKKEIIDELRQFKLHVRTLPNMGALVEGKVSISDLREIQIDDLLSRDVVKPNEILLGRTVVGKTVLVTGAGGSIGSELCRQVLQIGARRLVLFDMSEFSLYQVEKELRDRCEQQQMSHVEIVPVLGSITNAKLLHKTFDAWHPDTVFHAAAYKHVPLVEANAIEAVRNNVLGTFELVKACRAANVKDFILISTDKAVRPSNVMGASKRGAEQIVQFAAARSQGRYSLVRFGNVLGSSGSVVPLFKRQIEAGGPVTLTHREVTRFFMTIPEAAQLVIQASGMARGGEVFVLDMGKPVKIYDLARSMIQLSGLSVRDESDPTGDIEIVEIGLRPGEKLYEELLIGSNPNRTDHPMIVMAHEDFLNGEELHGLIERIEKCETRQEVLDILRSLVPEYTQQQMSEIEKLAS